MKRVITLLLTGCCILIVLSESPAALQTSELQTDAVSQRKHTSNEWNVVRGLRKRSASLGAKGLAAMETLLTGTKKTRTTKNARFYKKIGNRQTALDDFNSVEPVLAKYNPNRPQFGRLGERRIGAVGDRRLILMLDGDRKSRYSPVLEIRSATDALFDRIVYMIER